MNDKPTPISELRLEFAATIFIRECLRQWHKMHPGESPPMAILQEYPLRQQRALMKGIAKAIEASQGMNELYALFLKEKLADTQQSNTP